MRSVRQTVTPRRVSHTLRRAWAVTRGAQRPSHRGGGAARLLRKQLVRDHRRRLRAIFGSLATVIVAMEYLYLSSIVFLTGIQIDSLARSSVEGTGSS